MFCSKKPTSTEVLNHKFNNILSVFTKASDELDALISEQEQYQADLGQKISDLQVEQAANSKNITATKSVLGKIKNLIS